MSVSLSIWSDLSDVFWGTSGRIRALVETGPEQFVATSVVGVLFVGFVYLLHRGAQHAKDSYDDNLVEIVQALLLTLGAVLASLVIVFIWRLTTVVEDALAEFTITPETAVLVLVSAVTLAVTYTLTRVTKRLVGYSSGRINISPHQRELLHHVVQIFLFLTATTFIFALWSFDPTNLILGAGALGIVLGFAARKTLSGVLSGFVILFARPFEVGDWIAVGDREGIVTEITVYNTQLRTFNEEHVLIPNDSVTENEVINYSKTDRLRIITTVGVDFETDLSTAMSVATDAMESCDTVARSPSPDVVVDSFSDSAVVLRLRYWIDRPTIQQKLSAQNEVVEAVKASFDEEDIKIPYPQRELMARAEADGFHVTETIEDSADVYHPEGENRVEAAVRRVSKADRERVEKAVREIDVEDPTLVEEPVEERYGGDGGPDADDGNESDGAEPDGDSTEKDDTSNGGRATETATDESRDGGRST